ncbi:lasso peptide biosynthesis protein [Rhodohalobacter sp. 8-1]|uniref:lasso peptide biosynthesis protein n=1 Tax=Rhodohalobacter sp. 8-1 TaxID=3131972 RepID=UPI0030EE0F60
MYLAKTNVEVKNDRSAIFPADIDNGDKYFVSPITGELIVIPNDAWGDRDAQDTLLFRGISVDHAKTPPPFDPVSASPPLWGAHTSAPRSQSIWLHMSLPAISLMTRFMALSKIAMHVSELPIFREPLPFRQASLHLIKFTEDHPRSCLTTSFHQAAYLVRSGIPCAITIGVWIPTIYMHAWTTTIDNELVNTSERLVSDNRDKIAHYQPALRFVLP